GLLRAQPRAACRDRGQPPGGLPDAAGGDRLRRPGRPPRAQASLLDQGRGRHHRPRRPRHRPGRLPRAGRHPRRLRPYGGHRPRRRGRGDRGGHQHRGRRPALHLPGRPADRRRQRAPHRSPGRHARGTGELLGRRRGHGRRRRGVLRAPGVRTGAGDRLRHPLPPGRPGGRLPAGPRPHPRRRGPHAGTAQLAGGGLVTTTFRLPDLGEGLTESEIVTWHVAEGDAVELNQVLAEVETAKAVVELPSPYAGRIVTLHAAEGEVVPVGAPLVEFDVVAGRDAPPHGSEPVTAPTEPAAVVPAAAAPPEPATTGPAEPAPERHAVLVGYGPRTDAGARPRRRPRSWDTVPSRRPDAVEHRHTTPRAMPPVRMLARHLGVDLDTVRGSGPDGLVRRADVEAAAGTDRAQEGYETQQEARASTIVPVTGLRKHTARAMVESAFSAPHAAVHSTVAVTETLALLRRTKDRAGEHPATFL